MVQGTDEKVYRDAVSLLVNFKAVDGNKKLLINATDKEWLAKVQKIFKERYPNNQYVLKDFAIRVLRRNMMGEVVKWGKTQGFSLWEEKGLVIESA